MGDVRDFTAIMSQAREMAMNSMKDTTPAVDPALADIPQTEPEVEPQVGEAAPEAKTPEVKEPDTQTEESQAPDFYVANGKKVPLDWSKREEIKKQLSLAEGARTWQKERDTERVKRVELEKKYSEVNTQLESIVKTFETKGLEGLVDLLAGSPGSYKKWEDQVYTKRKEYDTADETTRKVLDARQEAESLRRELEADRLAKERVAKEAEERAAQATANAANQLMESAYRKHSLAGKLGDAEAEALANQAIWDAAKRELSKLPADTDIDDKMLNQIFEKQASIFTRAIGKKATQEVKQELSRKKDEAARNLNAAAAPRAKAASAKDEEVQRLINDNSVTAKVEMLKKIFGKKM